MHPHFKAKFTFGLSAYRTNHILLQVFKVAFCNKQFDSFLKSLNNAKSDLKWIRTVTNHDVNNYLGGAKYKRSIPDLEELLASFNVVNYYASDDDGASQFSGEIENGDAWYTSFRKEECKDGGCIYNVVGYSKGNHNNDGYLKRKGKELVIKSDQNEESEEKLNQHKQHPKRIQVKKTNDEPDYNDYDISKDGDPKKDSYHHENEAHHHRINNDKFKHTNDKYRNTPSSSGSKNSEKLNNESDQEFYEDINLGDPNQEKPMDNSQSEPFELKDQLEKTQNDLSHEAEYKLSKIEQEAMDKKSGPLKHPEYQIPMLMQRKAPEVSHPGIFKVEENHRVPMSKRSLDPLDEVKLKVSERLMLKGLGPSLPSDAIIDKNDDLAISRRSSRSEVKRRRRSVSNENFDEQFDGEMDDKNSKDDTETAFVARKLTSVNDYDLFEDSAQEDANLNRNNDEEIITDQEKNAAKVIDSSNNNILSEVISRFGDGKQQNLNQIFDNINGKELTIFSEDGDSITLDLNKDYLKGQNIASCGDPTKLIKVGSKVSNGSSSSSQSSKLSAECSPTSNTTTVTNKTLTDGQSNQLSFKLNLAFNATVLNMTKTNKPMQLSMSRNLSRLGPSSANIKEENKESPKIEKRDIIFPHLRSDVSKRTNKNFQNSLTKTTEESPLDCLMSGKLTAQLVKDVFNLVENNENFRSHILPALQNPEKRPSTGCNNLDIIKNEKNCNQINRSEQMLREVMETISAMIEQQVRSRTCIPLCSNLRSFYNLILSTRKENEKSIRSTRMQNFQKRVERSIEKKTSNFLEPLARQKYNVVKKLLRQYDSLPVEIQDKNKEIKDMLQMHLAYLVSNPDFRENSRRKRDYLFNNILNLKNSIRSRETDSEISPQFIKLLRTAELIRKNSLLTGDIETSALQGRDYI